MTERATATGPSKNVGDKSLGESAVVHVINGLGIGGSETMLYNLIRHAGPDSGIRHSVVSFAEGDHFLEPLRRMGVAVTEVQLRRTPITTSWRLSKILAGADVICSWSYHAHLASILTTWNRQRHLLWFVRHADLSRETNTRITRFAMWLSAVLSRYCDAIAYNGERSRAVHEEFGYRPPRTYVLPNGCDTSVYRPSSGTAADLKDLLGPVTRGGITVLSAANWRPVKDHAAFVEAFRLAQLQCSERLVAVLCGRGVDEANKELLSMLSQADLVVGRDVFLMGERTDLPAFLAGADVYVLHSRSEAFPNTLVQAMASGTRVVSTDVGPASELANGAFDTVPPGEPEALAAAIIAQVVSSDEQKDVRGRVLRRIIEEDYSLEKVVRLYEQVILDSAHAESVLGTSSASRRPHSGDCF